jgi:hypothetical protein
MKNKLTILLFGALAFFLCGIVFSQDDEKGASGGPAAGKSADNEGKPKSKGSSQGDLTAADKAALDWLYKMRLELKKGETEGVAMDSVQPLKSAHYSIKCNSTQKVAQYYSDMMETLYFKYIKVFGEFLPDRKVSEVIIYRAKDEFQRQPGAGPNVGGFYQPRTRMLVTYNGKFGMTMDTSTILAHEGTHQFQHLIIKGGQPQFFAVPIWLLEGMAVIFEAAEINVKDRKVNLRGVSNDRLIMMQQMIQRGTNKPLMQIIRTPQAQFQAGEYAHAGLLQYYLLFGGDKKLRSVYDNYLREAIDGAQKNRPVAPERFSILVEKFTKKTMAQFEEDWKKYVMGLTTSSLGRVADGAFMSDSDFFKFAAPSDAYAIECKNTPGASEVACVTRGKDDKVRVGVSVSDLEGDAGLKKYVEDMKGGKLAFNAPRGNYQIYEDEGENFRKANGYEAYETFRKVQSCFSTVNQGLQKAQTVLIYAYGRIYTFQIQCPYEKYDEYKPEFEKLLESFSPYLPAGMKK